MFLSELKMWYAWLIYAAVLNVAALVTFYYKAPAQPILPNIAFAVDRHTWEDDDDCIIFVMCRRPADEVAKKVHVKVTLSGDFQGGPKDELLDFRADEDKAKIRLRRDRLTKQVGKITARILDDTRSYAVGLREHTITISPPTSLVQFEAEKLTLAANALDGSFKVKRDSRPPSPLLVRLVVKDAGPFVIPPSATIPANADWIEVPFTVKQKPGVKQSQAVLVTLDKAENGPSIRVGERQHLTITQEAASARPRIAAAAGEPAGPVRRGAAKDWTITATLAAPVNDEVRVQVEVDPKSTAKPGVHYDGAFERVVRIAPNRSSGTLTIPLKANAELEPDGVDLKLTLHPIGDVEFADPAAKLSLHIDDDTGEPGDQADSRLALFVIMTKQAKKDWPGMEKELIALQRAKEFERLLGGRVVFVARPDRERATNLFPWRIGVNTGKTPLDEADATLLFDDGKPINDYFKPAMDAIADLGVKSRSKAFASYIVFASPDDPKELAILPGGGEKGGPLKNIPPLRTIYVAWVCSPKHRHLYDAGLPAEHWLVQNFGKTGRAANEGMHLYDREQLERADRFSDRLRAVLRDLTARPK